MKRFLTLILLIGAITAPTFYTAALAHTQRTAITTVLFNSRTSNLEVAHRFHLHDAEHAVKQIFGKSADIIGSDETRQKFSAYVAERFHILTDESNTEIPLEFVGYEIVGKFIWVYQETPAPQTTSLTIAHNALRDLWPDQINTVNVEGAFGVKSALFDGATEVARIQLKP